MDSRQAKIANFALKLLNKMVHSRWTFVDDLCHRHEYNFLKPAQIVQQKRPDQTSDKISEISDQTSDKIIFEANHGIKSLCGS